MKPEYGVIINLKELRVIFICTKDLRDMIPATHTHTINWVKFNLSISV